MGPCIHAGPFSLHTQLRPPETITHFLCLVTRLKEPHEFKNNNFALPYSIRYNNAILFLPVAYVLLLWEQVILTSTFLLLLDVGF